MGADSDPRYKTPEWRALRLRVLARDLHVCQIRGDGCTIRATPVDHIVSPHEGGDFWDEANLRAACTHCNSVEGGRLAQRLRKERAYTPSRKW